MEKKMLLRNKSQASGTSLQEATEYVDHDFLDKSVPLLTTTEDARFSSTRTPSTQILKSSLFTFMIPGATCLIK